MSMTNSANQRIDAGWLPMPDDFKTLKYRQDMEMESQLKNAVPCPEGQDYKTHIECGPCAYQRLIRNINVHGQEIDVNDAGALQAKLPFRYDLIDNKANRMMAEVLATGAEDYGIDNWRGISIEENINHAIDHLMAEANQDYSSGENHLAHAMCRVMFALAIKADPEGNKEKFDRRPDREVKYLSHGHRRTSD